MGRAIDFSSRVKELSYFVRNLYKSNDELSRSLAITKAQLMLDDYKYDIHGLNEYDVSQFCKELLSLLYTLE